MLCSNLVERLKIIVIIAIVVVSYASNVLTRSDQIAKNAIDLEKSSNNATIMKKVPFVEYFIEHNISEGAAKRSFREIGIKLLDEKTPRWCMECTQEIKEYCTRGPMLSDHCCCDSRHGTEQFPWLPHSCYVADRCRPSVSCIQYEERRQCCCNRILAEQWKEQLSSSMPTTTLNLFTQLACVLFLLIISRSLH